VAVLANAILALAEGGEAIDDDDDDDDDDALGGERGERRGSDDHDDDGDGDDGTDGPRRCRRGGGRPFPVASEDRRLACWTLSNLATPRKQGRDDLDVEGRGGTPPLCADVRDRT
jgi:hypothetical protein